MPLKWSIVGNHEYSGRGHGTRYVPQGLPEAPTKLRKHGRTNTVKLKESATKQTATPARAFLVSGPETERPSGGEFQCSPAVLEPTRRNEFNLAPQSHPDSSRRPLTHRLVGPCNSYYVYSTLSTYA
ncbi:unnamed protein product [Protopolystoma xenopodis]|uniref:Uncharacterized protein n=1 Tax=Protopolystoma xenopodis TaxID=117903 RepID=A0A3S5BF72_9PLAT|nr:unnamed protein product [Protopolystoma xenopodis]